MRQANLFFFTQALSALFKPQVLTPFFPEMSRGLAGSGIEKWTFDTNSMTISYYDTHGKEVLVKTIA
jgi:uncharacterized protein YbcV (DUF1398 family)